MANLTIQSPRYYNVLPSFYTDYPVTTSTVYEGSALCDLGSADGGDLFGSVSIGTNIVGNLVAGANFVGFANGTYVYNSTSYVAGTTTISVANEGIVRLTVSGLSSSSTGEYVYASDGNTFTVEVQEYIANSTIGRVVQILNAATGLALVHFQGVGMRSV